MQTWMSVPWALNVMRMPAVRTLMGHISVPALTPSLGMGRAAQVSKRLDVT